MGKTHESSKEAKKQALHTRKEKRMAKLEKKQPLGSPPFMGHHHSREL